MHYKKQIFPTFLYHKELAFSGKIFHKAEQLEALGAGWVESPADFDKVVESEKVEEISQEEVEEPIESGESEISEEVTKEEVEDLKEKVKKARNRRGK